MSNANIPHVAIIGGGIAGLSSAWYLQKAGLRYTLLEKNRRLGGLLHTRHIYEMQVEEGPDAFITRKPQAWELAHDLQIEDDIIGVNPTPKRIYVLSNGALHSMPDGVNLFVPTNIPAFMRSGLISLSGKMRALQDMFIPAKDITEDESLAEFVTRRMGREMLEKLADPLLAGVYNADMTKQSILATFPQYRHLEAEYGSLIKGMQARRPHDVKDKPPLMSFKNGVGHLINTLEKKLTGIIYTDTTVSSITRDKDEFVITLDDGAHMRVNAVILALPAPIAAKITSTLDETAAKALMQIRYEGVGNMTFAYKLADVPTVLDAYGMVIPHTEHRKIDGMQWNTSKWAGRAPDDIALIRVFFGGPHTRDMLKHNDDTLEMIIRKELADILDITAKPFYVSDPVRLPYAYPQYDVGHINRVQTIYDSLPERVAVAGNAYRGVGVPDTIQTARDAVAKIVEQTAVSQYT